MILFSHSVTARLQYIVSFFATELGCGQITITTSKDEFCVYDGPRINYSERQLTEKEIWIVPVTLLFEKTIGVQPIEVFDADGEKAFFQSPGNWPFDIFAASFYLLTRYEEYLPHEKDAYGRYHFKASFAFQHKVLDRPLVNLWIKKIRQQIVEVFPALRPTPSTFTFLPTYDIDMAWSYLHKGWWRNFGGMLQSLVRGQWAAIGERTRVLMHKNADPFDAYGWLHHLHERFKLKPYYFFLLSLKRGQYDKNISPMTSAMQALVRDHLIRYPVGIHPSWQSGDEMPALQKEIAILAKLSGNPVLSSRQHYIRMELPRTYRNLLDGGIKFDFSMGYGSINGFRASVASPFFWYDLGKEQATDLLLFPFCYMDANSFYEQHYSPGQALDEMRHYYQIVKEVNGYFIMIWHNSFLGSGSTFAGWRNCYEQFIEGIADRQS